MKFRPLLIVLSILCYVNLVISLFRQLTNTVGFCSGISPLPINSYCASVRYRFAVSEAAYLGKFRSDMFDYIGDSATLSSFGLILPDGGIASPCILQSLHDALAREDLLTVLLPLLIGSLSIDG